MPSSAIAFFSADFASESLPSQTPAPFAFHCLAIFLLVGPPVVRVLENRLGKPSPSIDARRNFFLRSLLFTWLATVAVLLIAQAPSHLFILPHNAPLSIHNGTWTVTTFLIIAAALLLIPITTWMVNLSQAKQTIQAMTKSSSYVIPRNRIETFWFAGLAISVAMFQEIAYRGFLLHYFFEFPFRLPFWGAIGFSILVAGLVGFGFGTRSLSGFAMSIIFSAVMVCLFIAANNLWLPIIVHALWRMAGGLFPAQLIQAADQNEP